MYVCMYVFMYECIYVRMGITLTVKSEKNGIDIGGSQIFKYWWWWLFSWQLRGS